MRSIGVNEVVFGMIMMTTVTFGVMTPPVGTALYAVSDIMECPIEETFKKGWPFYLAIVCVILFMIFFPQAVLFLPNLVYGSLNQAFHISLILLSNISRACLSCLGKQALCLLWRAL